MTIALQTFTAQDTDYITKLNNNAAIIQSSLNTLLATIGAQSNFLGTLNQGLLLTALFGTTTTIIGTTSYVASMTGSQLTLGPGIGWFANGNSSAIVINTLTTVLDLTGQTAGTYYACIDATGIPSTQTTATNALYSLVWDGTSITDVMLMANVLFTASDDVSTLASTTNSVHYSSLEARLEAIETAINETVAATAPSGSAALVLATPVAASGIAALRALALTDLPTLPPPSTATVSTLGIVKPDGTSITIASGVITAVAPLATASTVGVVKPDDTTLAVNSSGVLSVIGGTLTAPVVINTVTASTVGLIVRAAGSPSGASVVQIGTASGSTSTPTLTVALPNPVGAGNTLVAVAGFFNKTAANYTVDSAGNVYTQTYIDSVNGYFNINVSSGVPAGTTSVTMHSDGGYVQIVFVMELTGVGSFTTAQEGFATETAGTAAPIPSSTLSANSLAFTLGLATAGTPSHTNTALAMVTGTFPTGYDLWSGILTPGTYTDSITSTANAFLVGLQFFFAVSGGASALNTVPLQEWQDSTSTTLSGVNGAGQIVMALTSGTPTNTPSHGAMAFDPATGKLYAYATSGWVEI